MEPWPSPPTALVTTPDKLMELCAELREARTFAFDTEFIGETTYQPILCLVQVATIRRIALIDPMTLTRQQMRPFWELLADESLEKICHAGDQDVEIAWQHSGLITRGMFDTQIGAGMLGISYPTALWRAVEHFTGITLDKAHTFSAWNRRPLSQAQFEYAVDDVRYLPSVHQAMARRLAERGHTSWMRAACQEMCLEAAAPVDARKLYVKIRGAASLKSEQLAVLREIGALREQIAYEHDVPARAFLKDEVLYDIASRLPRSTDELARIRDMPREEVDSYGQAILQAIQRGLAVPEADRPSIHIPGDDPAEVKRLVELLWAASQVICLGQGVTPALVTSQSEVATIARHIHKAKTRHKPADVPTRHPIMQGWRRECLGEKLALFVNGQLKLKLSMQEDCLRADFQTASQPPAPVG